MHEFSTCNIFELVTWILTIMHSHILKDYPSDPMLDKILSKNL